MIQQELLADPKPPYNDIDCIASCAPGALDPRNQRSRDRDVFNLWKSLPRKTGRSSNPSPDLSTIEISREKESRFSPMNTRKADDQVVIRVCVPMNAISAHVSAESSAEVPIGDITRAIVVLRGRKVLLDAELAALYGVTTKRFNEQIRRNQRRFPPDFMFQLTEAEHEALRSHFATSNVSPGRGGRRYLPYVFTEHGAIMAATVLNSPRAIDMSVYVVRAFVKLREVLSSNHVLSRKLDELEQRLTKRLDEHDEAIQAILSAIRELMNPPRTTRAIGFTAVLDDDS
jgi:hypothetical protein